MTRPVHDRRHRRLDQALRNGARPAGRTVPRELRPVRFRQLPGPRERQVLRDRTGAGESREGRGGGRLSRRPKTVRRASRRLADDRQRNPEPRAERRIRRRSGRCWRRSTGTPRCSPNSRFPSPTTSVSSSSSGRRSNTIRRPATPATPSSRAACSLDQKKLDEARAAFDQGLSLWREVFDQYPSLIADVNVAEEVMAAIRRYQDLLKQQNQKLPEKFILQDVLDRNSPRPPGEG